MSIQAFLRFSCRKLSVYSNFKCLQTDLRNSSGPKPIHDTQSSAFLYNIIQSVYISYQRCKNNCNLLIRCPQHWLRWYRRIYCTSCIFCYFSIIDRTRKLFVRKRTTSLSWSTTMKLLTKFAVAVAAFS